MTTKTTQGHARTGQTTTQYRVVRDGAGIVSTHRTLTGAERSLTRQQRGAVRQGGYSEDYIEHHTADGWQRIDTTRDDT